MASRAATWAAFGAIVKRSIAAERRLQSHHGTIPAILRQRRAFAATPTTRQDATESSTPEKKRPLSKRKASRTPTNDAIAQHARVVRGSGRRAYVNPNLKTKDVTAYCAAELYDIARVRPILEARGLRVDEMLESDGLQLQVLHARIPDETGDSGDVFVFPSGTVVTWNVSGTLGREIVERWLQPAAAGRQLEEVEAEEMEYLEDPSREHSKILGDTIVLGTKASTPSSGEETTAAPNTESSSTRATPSIQLTRLAFSSALSRSTQLAVLETQLAAYFNSTAHIPSALASGRRLPFTRAFLLRKTGELLSIRAHLNLSNADLTDTLPDLFWDSPHADQLERDYEKLSYALDVTERIKVLNERMDYASEIAAVLRERLSEKHSTELEWLIILLITIEVAFGTYHLWQEWRVSHDPESTDALMREYLRRELGRAETGAVGEARGKV